MEDAKKPLLTAHDTPQQKAVTAKGVKQIGKHKCPFCGKYFAAARLRVHVLIHTGERPYRCKHCGNSFNNSGILRVHVRMHTGEKPYCCRSCGMRFRQCSHLKGHTLRFHTEDRKQFKCPKCDKTFLERRSIANHMRTHIEELGSASSGMREDTCHDFSRPTSIRRDMPTSAHEAKLGHLSGETMQHKCDRCGKCFDNYRGLSNHVRTHAGMSLKQSSKLKVPTAQHDEKEKKHKCVNCGNIFKEHRYLMAHIRNRTCNFRASPVVKEPYSMTALSCESNPSPMTTPSSCRASKLLRCARCDKHFQSSVELDRHMTLVHRSCAKQLSQSRRASASGIGSKSGEKLPGVIKQEETLNSFSDVSDDCIVVIYPMNLAESTHISVVESCRNLLRFKIHFEQLNDASPHWVGLAELTLKSQSAAVEALTFLRRTRSDLTSRLLDFGEKPDEILRSLKPTSVALNSVKVETKQTVKSFSSATSIKPSKPVVAVPTGHGDSPRSVHTKLGNGNVPGKFRPGQHKCKHCGKTFPYLTALNVHMKRHAGQIPRRGVKLFGKTFAFSAASKIRPKTHKCTVCEKSFRDFGYLQCHMQLHFGTPPSNRCDTCGKVYRWLHDLRFHIRKIHPGVPVPGARVFRNKRSYAFPAVKTTDVAGDKLPKSGTKIPKDVTSAKVSLQTTCRNCGRGFESESSLESHQTVHDVGASSCCCNACRAKPTISKNQVAIEKPGAEKPTPNPPAKAFNCPRCDLTFQYPCRLRRHMKIHSGRGKILNKSSATQSSKQPCSGAQKQSRSSVGKSEEAATPVLPFGCGICGQSFRTEDETMKHFDDHRQQRLRSD